MVTENDFIDFHLLPSSADDQFSSSMETNVVIRHDGQIMWDQPAISKSSCKVDVSFFPFDAQQCRLTFGSWTHNGNQMDLHNALDSADLADFVENVEWEVLGMPAKKNVILYGCCSDPYPDITYTLHLKRRASFYIFNLLIPCMMISFLAPLGFYLPADSGEKVSLGVTVLLALTVFQLLVAESMPPSENVPLIGEILLNNKVIDMGKIPKITREKNNILWPEFVPMMCIPIVFLKQGNKLVHCGHDLLN